MTLRWEIWLNLIMQPLMQILVFGILEMVKSIEKTQYMFSGPGKYNVCLTVKNKCGKDTLCQEIEILNKLSSRFTLANSQGCAPFNVKFVNASTGAKSYIWNFLEARLLQVLILNLR